MAENNQKLQKIKKKLDAFKNAKEWSDFISLLTDVDNALKKIDNIPKEIELLLTRRLNQSLNPALPAGVHNKALQTYELIIQRIPLTDHLTLGLFSYGIYSKLSVRKNYLHVLEGLKDKSISSSSYILGLLPFLEEENNKYFDQAAKLIESKKDEPAIWKNFLLCPELRISVLNYFKVNPVTISDIQVKAIQKGLFDEDSLTIRGTLDLLNRSVKLNDLIKFYNSDIASFEYEDLTKQEIQEKTELETEKQTPDASLIISEKENVVERNRIIIKDEYLHDELVKLTTQILSLYLKKEVTINKKINYWLQNDKVLQKKILKRIINFDLDLFYKLFQNLIIQDEVNDKEIIDLLLYALFKTKKKSKGFDIVFSLLENSFFWRMIYIEFRRIINKNKKFEEIISSKRLTVSDISFKSGKVDREDEKRDKMIVQDKLTISDAESDEKFEDLELKEGMEVQLKSGNSSFNQEPVGPEMTNEINTIHAVLGEKFDSNNPIDSVIGEKIPEKLVENSDKSEENYKVEHVSSEDFFKSLPSSYSSYSEGSKSSQVRGGNEYDSSISFSYNIPEETEKSSSILEYSRSDLSESEEVGPNEMLDLLQFLFKKAKIDEENNNHHALHMLLLICMNYTIFNESKMNETILILFKSIDLKKTGQYIENAKNRFNEKEKPEHEKIQDDEDVTSIKKLTIPVDSDQKKAIRTDKTIKSDKTAMKKPSYSEKEKSDEKEVSLTDERVSQLEEMLDEFYIRNGNPVDFMIFENQMPLSRETLHEIVQHVNPFSFSFWLDFIEKKDLKDNFFILRRVIRDKSLLELKKHLFNQLFYKYDEKLFCAYEIIYTVGFEDLMIEEIQKENISTICSESQICLYKESQDNILMKDSQKKISQIACFKILEYSFNVLNFVRFYRTLNIIANRKVSTFLSTLISVALFDLILEEKNIFLIHKMLKYNHKFVKYLKKGVNIFEVIFPVIKRYSSRSSEILTESYEYNKLILIIRNLLALNLVPTVRYTEIYSDASISFFYDTHELIEHIIQDQSAYKFFIESVPMNNFIFRLKNRSFLKAIYLGVIDRYSHICEIRTKVSGKDEIIEQNLENLISKKPEKEKIDLPFLLDILRKIQKRRNEFDMDFIVEKSMFICATIYHKRTSHVKPLIVETIYHLDPEKEDTYDELTFQTVITNIFEIIITEPTFITHYIKYFQTKLPLNERLNKKIFLLVLQKGKYGYLNKVFNQKHTLIKHKKELKDLVNLRDIEEVELITIKNIYLDEIEIRSIPYFNHFFNDKIANIKKIETLSQLYFLMSNMGESFHSQRILEQCLYFLYKLLQNRKKLGTNLFSLCLKNCQIRLTDKTRTLILNICFLLIKKEHDVNVEIDKSQPKNDLFLPHQTNPEIETSCVGCNEARNIALDALIYHKIGYKEFFEHFIDSTDFFSTSTCSLSKYAIILSNIPPEKVHDLLSKLATTTGIFSTAESLSHNNVAILQKISFFIFSCEKDAFVTYLTAIIPWINDLIVTYKNVRKEIFNLIAIIFLKCSHKHLSSLFPIFFSEIENNTFLESLRSLEMLMLISSKETVEQRWHISAFDSKESIFKKKLKEIYPGTTITKYTDPLPEKRKLLLKTDKLEFLKKVESYYQQLDEDVWTIEFKQVFGDILMWFVH